MPKVSEQYRDERRAHILRSARLCFLRNGFHATSMQDLFAEAGLSSGAVYRYFASKDDMILAIAEDSMAAVVAAISTVNDEEHGGSIGTALAAAADVVQDKHEQDGLGGLAIQVWAEALRNPRLAERLAQLLTRVKDELTETARRHQATGDLPAQVPAEALASVVGCFLPGYILQLAVLGPDWVSGVPDGLRALWPERTAS